MAGGPPHEQLAWPAEPGASVALEDLGKYCGVGVPLVCRGAASALVQLPQSGAVSDAVLRADSGWSFRSLERSLGTAECTILHSKSSRFVYADASAPLEGKERRLVPTSTSGTFGEFLQCVRGGAQDDGRGRTSHWYCQKGFPLHDSSSDVSIPLNESAYLATHLTVHTFDEEISRLSSRPQSWGSAPSTGDVSVLCKRHPQHEWAR